MSQISTHILDTSLGRPAAGVVIRLEQETPEGWQQLSENETNADGRVAAITATPLLPGRYRLTAEIGLWFAKTARETLYPVARIDFMLTRPDEHFHLPFLIAPWGWSTYRGS